jgi:hypothetical protein
MGRVDLTEANSPQTPTNDSGLVFEAEGHWVAPGGQSESTGFPGFLRSRVGYGKVITSEQRRAGRLPADGYPMSTFRQLTTHALPYADHVRLVSSDQPFRWLRLGWQDLIAAPTVSLCYGLLFVVAGFVLTVGLWRIGDLSDLAAC